jgi:hypothetical protein
MEDKAEDIQKKKRLDKALCNHSLIDAYSSITVNTILKQSSDYFPILLDFQLNDIRVPQQFKFLKMWTLHDDCKNIVAASWNEPVVGCPMFVLSQKLKSLKLKLKTWNKETFGNVHELVKNAETHLLQIQTQILQNWKNIAPHK